MQDRERDTDVYNGLLDSEGEGEGGMNWEEPITSPGSMQDTGRLGLVPWDDPEGWYGEGAVRCLSQFIGLPSGSDGKESACKAGDPGLITTHSSMVSWRIPWTEEPGELYNP